jgi:hypothetical protein
MEDRTKGWFLPVLPTTLARLLLRSQAERKATTARQSGKSKGKGFNLDDSP